MRNWIGYSLLVTLALAPALACRPRSAAEVSPDGQRQGKPSVYVVNYPLEFFASRIGGEWVDVQFPAPADVDPAFWKPDDAVIGRYQQADLILVNGAGYAKWTQQISLPDSRVVDTSAGFAKRLIHVDNQVVHSHGPAGEHSHQGVAFTTWLDPQLAMLQAAAVYQALVNLVPAKKAQLDANYRQLNADLEKLDRQLERVAKRYEGQPLLASHPVYQYLSRRCGWKLHSRHWEPEQIPPEQEWKDLSKLLESQPSQWMLWEASPHRETAEKLGEMGIRCVVFQPCGNRPEASYLQVMADNIERLESIFPN